MKERTISSVFIVLAVVLAVLSKLWIAEIFDVFVAVIGVVSATEVCNMLAKKDIKHNRFLGSMFVAILYVPVIFCENTSLNVFQMFLFMIVAFLAWCLITFIFEIYKNSKNGVENVFENASNVTKNTALVGIYPSLLISLLFVLNHLDGYFVINNKYFTIWIIVLTFAITMLTDTFALIVGKTLKGPKVCPKISPNKSWSGCVGGLVGGIVASLAVWGILHISIFTGILEILNMNVWGFLGIGIVGSVLSQIGDFFESYLKRKAGVKDAGNLFPGHGGMLDRIDALMFNVLFITIFVSLVI